MSDSGGIVSALTGPSSILAGSYTVDTLPTPNAGMVGSYARVTDLFGEKTDLVLCSVFGTTYFWQPVRPQWARSIAGNQNLTLTPMKAASILRITGTMTASRTYTFDTTLAWPGAQFKIAFDGTLGLFGVTLAGLDLGATLSLLLGGRRRAIFDGAAWQTF